MHSIRKSFALIAAVYLTFALNGTSAEDAWTITQSGTGFSHNTSTGYSSSKGVTREGLISVSNVGPARITKFWDRGAYGVSIDVDSRKVIDGHNLDDVSRLTGFRLDRDGTYAFVKSTKGPKAIVELIVDGRPVARWPRNSIVRLLSYKAGTAIVSVFSKSDQSTKFIRVNGLSGRSTQPTEAELGTVDSCAVIGSKVRADGIALQLYCDPGYGSDIALLDFASGTIVPILNGESDEIFGSALGRQKGSISVLSVTGSPNARRAFHAISGIMLKDLGEPMAYASDGAGKQSWSQSYRTMTLGKLFLATQHPVFADLAVQAMRKTLQQTNKRHDISGPFNPSCGWASRLYSIDRQTPFTLLINQAMIAGSLLETCEMLGNHCPGKLNAKVIENAKCLIRHFEPNYSNTEGLYRISYGAPFRYDGITAPWNWQLRWATVLDKVGRAENKSALISRANGIADRFVGTWETTKGEALWRYWTPSYYEGWKPEQDVSVHRPKQVPRSGGRYEDLNHAGISLMGLGSLSWSLPQDELLAVQSTLRRILNDGPWLARDMDGTGPRSPRWMPGAGWHYFATNEMQERYDRLLPGSVSSDQHLAYASMIDPGAPFDLTMTLSYCKTSGCRIVDTWRFDSIESFMRRNPLFAIRRLPKEWPVQIPN